MGEICRSGFRPTVQYSFIPFKAALLVRSDPREMLSDPGCGKWASAVKASHLGRISSIHWWEVLRDDGMEGLPSPWPWPWPSGQHWSRIRGSSKKFRFCGRSFTLMRPRGHGMGGEWGLNHQATSKKESKSKFGGRKVTTLQGKF